MEARIIEIEDWTVVAISKRELKEYELASVKFNDISGLFRNNGETEIYFCSDMDGSIDCLKSLVGGLEDGSVLEDGYEEEIEKLHESCKNMIKKLENTTYQIKCTPNYFENQLNAPQTHLVTMAELEGDESNREIATFDTEEAAQEAIDHLEEGTYYLHNGKAGRPDYEIVEEGDYGSDCKKGEYEFHIEESEVPPSILNQLQNSTVDFECVYSTSYDTYSAYVNDDDGEKRWGIVFTVSTIAQQSVDNDLSRINWENEIYTCESL